MSENSGRAEASAPLPPRKRLLAGFKWNSWSPCSSPSCASPLQSAHTTASLNAASLSKLDDNLESASIFEGYRKDNPDTSSLVKFEDSLDSASMVKIGDRGEDNLDAGSMAKLDSSLDSSSIVKLEDYDDGSVEQGDRDFTSFAAESMDIYHFRQRKSKRLRALPVVVTRKTTKKVSRIVSAEKDLHADGFSITVTDKDFDVSNAVVEVSADAKVIALAPTELAERDIIAAVKAKEVKAGGTVPVVGKYTIAACPGDLKPGLSTWSKAKEDESVCSEVSKPTRNRRNKVKEEDGKPRRNHSRQHHDKNKESDQNRQELQTDQNRQELQTDRSSLIPPPFSDEGLARQLHYIMNSSQRISRRLRYNEDGPLLSPMRK